LVAAPVDSAAAPVDLAAPTADTDRHYATAHGTTGEDDCVVRAREGWEREEFCWAEWNEFFF